MLDRNLLHKRLIKRPRRGLPPRPQLRNSLHYTLLPHLPHSVRRHRCSHDQRHLLRVQVGRFWASSTCSIVSCSMVPCHLATTGDRLHIPLTQPSSQTPFKLQSQHVRLPRGNNVRVRQCGTWEAAGKHLFTLMYVRSTHAIHSSGTMSCPWYSESTYTYVNSGGVVAHTQ